MSNEKKVYKNRLFILRKCAGLSQDEVCEQTGINRRSLYDYEHCIRPIPSDKLIEFARLYKCSTDHVIYFDDERTVENGEGKD